MKKFFCLFAVLAFTVLSCSKEDASPAGEQQKSGINKTVFHATTESFEPGTKVFADENLTVLWNEDDRISVFNRRTLNDQYMFMGEDGDNGGDFEEIPANDPVSWTALDHIYAVYPFSPDNVINSEGTQITTNLPAEQLYKEHSFGIGANTMAAVTDDNFFAFKNVCGYLKFRFYGENVRVKSIKLEGNNGEKIAGKAYIAPVFGGTPSLSLDNSATGAITITCEEPVTLGSSSTEATEFIFVIPPTTFTRGFKVTVTDVYGKTFTKSSSKSLAISRNKMESMSPMKVSIDYTSMPFTIRMVNDGTVSWSAPSSKFEYSIDDGATWTQFSSSSFSQKLNAGEEICFRSSNEITTVTSMMNTFKSTVSFDVFGNIASLLYQDFADKTTLPNQTVRFNLLFQNQPVRYADKFILPFIDLTRDESLGVGIYESMFTRCGELETAPELPATTLEKYCYRSMFNECTNLKKGPSSLYGTEMKDVSCSCMFQNCKSLATAPALPATVLGKQSYYYMFRGCSSLVKAPEIPATTVSSQSCYYMFNECSSLVDGPSILPATTLATECYQAMFYKCSSLVNVPDLPATILAKSCYEYMFFGCTSLVSAPELPATELEFECYDGMFWGCTSLLNPPALPATTLAEKCYYTMFHNCTSLVKAPALPATTLAENCYDSMFYNCYLLQESPVLPAKKLVSSCYSQMFYGCSSLQKVTCLAEQTITESTYTYQWLKLVSLTGTFIKASRSAWTYGSASFIPSDWTIENYQGEL